MGEPDHIARSRRWLYVATALGLAHAAISLSWALGATWLLGTVGGQLDMWARDGSVGTRLALGTVAAAKVLLVLLTWQTVQRRGGRPVRVLTQAGAGILVLYGGVLTVVEIAALAAADPGGADGHALRWHAYFWDPWFLLWGMCIAMALRLTRNPAKRPHRRPAPALTPRRRGPRHWSCGRT